MGSSFAGDLHGPVTFPISGHADLRTALRVGEINRNADRLQESRLGSLAGEGAAHRNLLINDIITSS